MDRYRQMAQEIQEYMVGLRRHFHRHPELSWKEVATTRRIRQELDAMGIPWTAVEDCPADTATIATLQGPAGAPVIALRADIDALPIQEETGVDYASVTPGVMHACGHDAHAAILLGTARLLQSLGAELRATVRLLFQPAEEIVDGAERMIEHSLMADVQNVAGLHMWPALPAGEIAVQPGPRMASADTFEIDVIGRSGHGAAPHSGVDALYIASVLETCLQSVVARLNDPLEPLVVSVGTVRAGTALNIIAPKAEMVGTIRTFSRELRAQVPRQVAHMAKHIALAFGAEAEFRLTPGAPPVINDPFSSEIGAECAKLASAKGILGQTRLSTGAEDFAYFLERFPGAFAYIGCGKPEGEETVPVHHERFELDENSLVDGAAYFLHYVTRMQEALA